MLLNKLQQTGGVKYCFGYTSDDQARLRVLDFKHTVLWFDSLEKTHCA